METKNLVLRTIYIDPDVDDQLRTEAFDKRTSKNDLLRQYLRLGMETAKSAIQPATPAVEANMGQGDMDGYTSRPGNLGAAEHAGAATHSSGESHSSPVGNGTLADTPLCTIQ